MTITFLLCNMTIGFIEISRAEVFKVNLKSDKWYIIPYTKINRYTVIISWHITLIYHIGVVLRKDEYHIFLLDSVKEN